MQIFSFDESNQNDYSKFITTHASGSFLQSWDWGRFQETQGKIIFRFGIREQDELIGTVQLLKTKVPHLPGYYLYAPYGPLLKESINDELALTELQSFLKEKFPDSWFYRFEPNSSLPLSGTVTQRIQPSKTLITDISQDTEKLLSEMHSKTRYNIKVAAKHDVQVTSESSYRNEAVELLTKTSSRQNYHSYPASYYNSMLGFFEGIGNGDCGIKLYKAIYKNELAACAIMIDSGNTRTYLFGGSNDSFRNVMAPYALHWQAINDAKEKGLTNYDWWGIETATGKLPGFVQFKLRWGGEQIAYPPAVDIVQNAKWYKIYSILRKVNRLF